MLNHYRNPHNNHSCATSVVASSLRIHRITRITRVNVNIKKKSKKYFLPSQKQNKYVFNKYIWHGRNSDNNKGIFIKKRKILFLSRSFLWDVSEYKQNKRLMWQGKQEKGMLFIFYRMMTVGKKADVIVTLHLVIFRINCYIRQAYDFVMDVLFKDQPR